MIRQVTASDIPRWLEVVREVEPLFGPMIGQPGFDEALQAAVDAGVAWCVGDGDRPAGFVLLDPEHNEIAWLAVSNACRGKGCGSALISHALAQLDPNRDVRVQTFAPEVAAGAAARKLYLRAGFADEKRAGPNPANVETVIMIRRADCAV